MNVHDGVEGQGFLRVEADPERATGEAAGLYLIVRRIEKDGYFAVLTRLILCFLRYHKASRCTQF